MKRIFTLLSFVAISGFMFGQSPRMVLIEHFTQASCPPCAPANEAIEPIIQNNIAQGKAIAIKYQVSWPGFDPMHEDNPVDINNRRNYYGVNSVPNTVMDGAGPTASTQLVTQSNIDSRQSQTSPFEIEILHEVGQRFDGVSATMKITATEDVSGTFIGHIAIIEEHIDWGTPAGTNGETEFFNVVKKMLPSAAGTVLPSTWTVGQTETIEVNWNFENVYDLTQIAVVGFVQNNRDREVMQAAYSESNLQIAGENDALLTQASAEGDFALQGVCGNQISPLVEIMNAGTSKLTSLDIFYKINGGTEHKYEWNGFLDFLGKTQVTLPTVNFENRLDNYINFRTANPNGEADNGTANDEFAMRFAAATQTSMTSFIQVRSGPLPSGITWSVVDSEGNSIAEGGPYTTPFSINETQIELDPNSCYKLTSNNNSNSLNGFVRLVNDSNEELAELLLESRGEFRTDFGTYNLSSINKVLNIESLSVYPNPSSNVSVIEFTMKEAAQMNFILTNSIGQIVWSATENIQAGLQRKDLNFNNLPNGIYFLKLQTEEGILTTQIAVQK